jgi:Ca2+-binding EF-hand superfamily protein
LALGKQGDQKAVSQIMDRADVNGDGEISYDEYYRLMNMDKFGDAEVNLDFIS